MAARTPSPRQASSVTASLIDQNEISSSPQPLTTLVPKRNFSRVVGDRRKYSVLTVTKDLKPAEKALDKVASGYMRHSDEDVVLRQAFDFGSLQNLQDGTLHHRPINLKDLERLESEKFIMPLQGLSNQTRKRSAWSRKDRPTEGGESTVADVPCSNEQGGPQNLRPGSPSNSATWLSSGLLDSSFSQLPAVTGIPDQNEFRHHSTQENECSVTNLGETTRSSFWNTAIRRSTPPLVSFTQLAASSALDAVSSCLGSVLEASKRRSNIPKDMVRIRWICKCGKQLYDDFIEKRPGAARILEKHLNRPRERVGGVRRKVGETGSESSSASISSRTSASSGLSYSTRATSFISGDLSNPDNLGNRSPYIPVVPTYGPQTATDTGPLHEPLWLLACAERHKFTTKLMHLDVDPYKVGSDRDLALLVKKQYLELRPKWRRFLRLRGLYTIQFVQFEAHRNHVVDIRKCPDLPEKSNINYKFLPSDVIPPVGENYLMHLFHHPEDYEYELITYKRIPKKRGMKLRVCDRADVGIGWGVHLVEGFLAYKVWTLFTGVFVLSSVVFAIVWTVQKGDIQGAFGVAAYACALSTLVIGCSIAYLE